jgi:hypothetical protein
MKREAVIGAQILEYYSFVTIQIGQILYPVCRVVCGLLLGSSIIHTDNRMNYVNVALF